MIEGDERKCLSCGRTDADIGRPPITLEPEQVIAARRALAGGASKGQVAEALGVHRNTLPRVLARQGSPNVETAAPAATPLPVHRKPRDITDVLWAEIQKLEAQRDELTVLLDALCVVLANFEMSEDEA